MKLGQITDEIYKVVSNYHVASMGNDNREIKEASDEYQRVIRVYGTAAVGEVVRYYNENIIGKAQRMIELTFDTWEEFDKAIAGIVSLETAIATPEK